MHYACNWACNDAYIFTPSTNKETGEETGMWTKTADGPYPRQGHAMSSLGNGKVLMYGGSAGDDRNFNDAYIFSLSTNEKTGEETGTWTKVPDGPSARIYHAMSSLENGKVLVYGGIDDKNNLLNDAYIFVQYTDKKSGEETGTWVRTADGPRARFHHAMASLGNGKVLMYGGSYDKSNDENDASIFALSFNKTAGVEVATWTRTADGPSARSRHAMSSLGNGKVLMFGSFHYSAVNASIFTLSTNEITGEEKGTWARTKTTDGPSARYGHAMSSLGNGTVLMCGGNDGIFRKDTWVFR